MKRVTLLLTRESGENGDLVVKDVYPDTDAVTIRYDPETDSVLGMSAD